jgi:hypothetical protein
MSVTATANLGAVASVRGSVVDVLFDGPLPPIYSVLHTGRKTKSSSKCWRREMRGMCAGFHVWISKLRLAGKQVTPALGIAPFCI